MHRLRWIGIVVVLLAGAAAAYAYWGRGNGEADGGYVTAALARGPVTATVIATGTVNPVTTVQVGTYVSGPIIALDVDFNSIVTKGQRVAQIDPAPFLVKVQRADANLANARAKVEKSRADLTLKRLTLERNRELRGRDFIAQNDVDTAQSNYDQAIAQLALDEAGIKLSQAELADARISLAYTDITSPVDGVVVSRSVDVGQTVAASFQTPTLFLIAQDLTKMQVNASVSESDIGSVHDGQAATFTVDAYPGREFSGTVRQVRNAPVTLQNVVTYDVIVGVDNLDLALKPGMTATIAITTAHADDVLRLPVRALTFNPHPAHDGTPAARPTAGADAGPGVWRLQADGRLERVAVATGLRDDLFVEVKDGALQAGDQVALAIRKTTEKAEGPSIPGMPRMRR
ncbi:MAG: efflux RND transporter periplasmic adaptor subunit [Candidatus Binatia bacterium]